MVHPKSLERRDVELDDDTQRARRRSASSRPTPDTVVRLSRWFLVAASERNDELADPECAKIAGGWSGPVG